MLGAKLRELHAKLGISADFVANTSLSPHEEAAELVDIGKDESGRSQRMQPNAANAWHSMCRAAEHDGVQLQIVSAFRSPEYQVELIQRHLGAGRQLTEILQQVAPPGFSEHHTGRAVDLTTPGFEAVETEFENSAAFVWLTEHAAEYGFYLSYPRNNEQGIAYEPWHWCFRED